MSTALRRGARHPDLVPGEVLELLAAGDPSVNHMEQIAMDMGALLESQFPELAGRADELRRGGLVVKMRLGGRILWEEMGGDAYTDGHAWRSDTVRGWGAMAIGAANGLSLAERLTALRPFADDLHFAVREWAWLSLRPHVIGDAAGAIELLRAWVLDPSARVRRFASEVTRPRGVWSAHIPELKTDPALGRVLLEPLRSDPCRYVQDSVANWLNDASKSRPGWVRDLCDRWESTSPSSETRRICRRARRSIAVTSEV